MNSIEARDADDLSLHAAVYRVVRDNIAGAVLRPGMTLGENSLAEQFAISRMPVARALRELEAEGLVTKVPGRGFRIAGPGEDRETASPPLQIPESVQELARGRAGWAKLYERVEHELVACMPFGRYKIIELTMADYHGVSRTVTRDLLGRLEERGLIERAGRSQCYLPALTPDLVRDLYEVRRLLEPAALRTAAPTLEAPRLLVMRDALVAAEARYPAVSIEELDVFETQLHVDIVNSAPNRRLVAALRASQAPLLATNYLLKRYIGTPAEEPFLAEHRLVVELLLQRAPEAAASALDAHLVSSLRKMLARLAGLTGSHVPVAPPYLQQIKETRG